MNRTGSASPWGWITFWAALLALGLLMQGRFLLEGIYPPRTWINDFFQDWASARYFLDGEPAYAPLDEAVHRYLGHERDVPLLVTFNAHPPTSILVVLPLAWLDYSEACLVWNLLSLACLALSAWLMVRVLGLQPPGWWFLPTLALLLFAAPFIEQMRYTQFNLLLLALITGSWAADRRDRPWLAGGLLGLAATIKLFPGYLLLYFLGRRNVRALAGAGLVGIVFTAATVGVLGTENCQDYVERVVAQVNEENRASWMNASLPGYWNKLLAGTGTPGGGSGGTISVVHRPEWARWAGLLSGVLITLLVGWVVWQAHTPSQRDLALALSVAGMLLVSPITWPHYFLLLLLPAVLLFYHLSPGTVLRWALWPILILLALPPGLVWVAGMRAPPSEWNIRPVPARITLTVLSLYTYALVAFFLLTGLAWWRLRRFLRKTPS